MNPLLAAAVTSVAGVTLVYVLALLLRPLSPVYRGQRQRLGSAREVKRFRRSWWSGTVPPDADRWLWTAELDHWPDADHRSRALRRIAVCAGVLVAALLALGIAASGGDVRALLASVLPPIVLVCVFAVIIRLLPDPVRQVEQRTARFRAGLQERPPTASS